VPLFNDKIRQGIRERLQGMVEPVKIINFTQELECPSCRETSQMLKELVELAPKLSLETLNLQIDREQAAACKVDKIPATLIGNESDYRLRFFGIPAGYEFAVLLDDIIGVSTSQSGLHSDTLEKVQGINTPVHLQVLVTPT
jgi:alkyl hydroperoxide reductase subunit AhpF